MVTVSTDPTQMAMLVLDVDGTLLLGDGTLPASRESALRTVAARVPTIFATGKTWPSIAPLATSLGLAGPHLTCNGAASVSLEGHVEVLSSLPATTVTAVLAGLDARGIPRATYLADGTSVAPAWSDRFDQIARVAEAPPVIDVLPDDAKVLKVLAVVAEDEEDDELRALAADVATVHRTGHWFLEWNAQDASKGRGLELLCRRHGVDLGHVVAVGDSENDVSMFEKAGLGVAVNSASAIAIASAGLHLDRDIAAWLEHLTDGGDLRTR